MSEPAAVEPHVDEEGRRRYACPECGQEFDLAMRLGLHRKKEHGVEGKGEKGRGKRTRTRAGAGTQRRGESRQTRRARAVRETITEFLDFTDELRGRGQTEPGDLADVIRRDASRIADSLAWAAERLNPLAWAVDHLAGHGSAITFARGFLGVGTWLARRWRQALASREQGADVFVNERGEYVDADGNPVEFGPAEPPAVSEPLGIVGDPLTPPV